MAKRSDPGAPTLPALDAAPAATQADQAPRHEYDILRAIADEEGLLDRLNGLGAAGWQAFAVAVLGEHLGAARLAIFLRREVRP